MTATKTIGLTAAIAMALGTLGMAAPAQAQQGWYGDRYESRDDGYRNYQRGDYYRGGYENSRGGYYRGDQGNRDQAYRNQGYRGQSGYRGDRYDRCGSGNGTAGTIIGAIAGGLLGHEVVGRRGDRTAGTIVGGAVGAVAGRAIDKSDDRCR